MGVSGPPYAGFLFQRLAVAEPLRALQRGIARSAGHRLTVVINCGNLHGHGLVGAQHTGRGLKLNVVFALGDYDAGRPAHRAATGVGHLGANGIALVPDTVVVVLVSGPAWGDFNRQFSSSICGARPLQNDLAFAPVAIRLVYVLIPVLLTREEPVLRAGHFILYLSASDRRAVVVFCFNGRLDGISAHIATLFGLHTHFVLGLAIFEDLEVRIDGLAGDAHDDAVQSGQRTFGQVKLAVQRTKVIGLVLARIYEVILVIADENGSRDALGHLVFFVHKLAGNALEIYCLAWSVRGPIRVGVDAPSLVVGAVPAPAIHEGERLSVAGTDLQRP